MAFKEKEMKIAIACDRRLYDYAKVLINNLIKTQPNLRQLYVVIEDNKIPNYTAPSVVKYYNINNYPDFLAAMKKIPQMTELGPLACVRCYFPDILPCDKVIYLDIDIIVYKSLDSMWNLDISDYYLAGVEDLNIRHPSNMQNYLAGLNYGDYINSGVLLMNLKKMREDNITKKITLLFSSLKMKFLDQDALNLICAKKNYYLNSSYNSSCLSGNVTDPIIFHGAGAPELKPWHENCKRYNDWLKNKE